MTGTPTTIGMDSISMPPNESAVILFEQLSPFNSGQPSLRTDNHIITKNPDINDQRPISQTVMNYDCASGRLLKENSIALTSRMLGTALMQH